MPPKDQERLTRIQESLRQNQWDALVLFHPDNIVMASGMLPGSIARRYGRKRRWPCSADYALVARGVCPSGELGRRNLDVRLVPGLERRRAAWRNG